MRVARGLLLSAVLCAFVGPAAAEGPEPEFDGKKLSEWLKTAESAKTGKERRRAVLVLEQFGANASRNVMPAIVKALRDDADPVVRKAAARAAGRAVAAAVKAAIDKKDDAPRFDNVRDALGNALRTEKDDGIREAAALALGDLGGDARGVIGSLALALKDKNSAIAKAAAASVRRMGLDARDAQAEIIALLSDKTADADARADAAIALGQIKPDASAALPPLKDVITDAKADDKIGVGLRKVAIETIGRMGKSGAEATPFLAELLAAKDTPPALRLAAVGAIDTFGVEGKAAIPALVAVLSDRAVIASMNDRKLIEKTGGDGTVDYSRFVRCLAMQALGRMGKELDAKRSEAVRAIVATVDDSTTEVCVTAIEALGNIAADGFGTEAESAKKKIDGILARDGRKTVRDAAEAAAVKMMPKKEK